MVVSSKTPCPYCKQEGKTVFLQYDVGLGRTYCANGHDIKDTAEIETPKTAPSAPKMAFLEAPAPPELTLEPLPEPKAVQVAEAPPSLLQDAPKAVPSTVPAPPARPNGEKPLSALDRLAKNGYIELPGGDVTMQIRIAERYVGPLKEAAARYYPPTRENPDPFQRHIQDVIDRAIDLGWAW